MKLFFVSLWFITLSIASYVGGIAIGDKLYGVALICAIVWFSAAFNIWLGR